MILICGCVCVVLGVATLWPDHHHVDAEYVNTVLRNETRRDHGMLQHVCMIHFTRYHCVTVPYVHMDNNEHEYLVYDSLICLRIICNGLLKFFLYHSTSF